MNRSVIKKFFISIVCLTLAVAISYLIAIALSQTLKISNFDKTIKKESLKQISANVPSSFKIGEVTGKYSSFWLPYDLGEPDAYCMHRGGNLIKHANGVTIPDKPASTRHSEMYYSYESTQENIAQTIGYALYQKSLGLALNGDVQVCIWSSWQWYQYSNNYIVQTAETKEYSLDDNSGDLQGSKIGDTNNMMGLKLLGPMGREQQFANFEHIALKNTNTLNITSNTANDNNQNLKVLVNQTDKTYTVGPYDIDFDGSQSYTLGGESTLGELIKREIIGTNLGETDSNRFCTGNVSIKIVYKNNTVTTVDSKDPSAALIDENGNVIAGGFPDFGKQFYVRYKLPNDENIVDSIQPIITIQYMNKIDVVANVYRPGDQKYEIHYDIPSAISSVSGYNVEDPSGSKSGDWYLVSRFNYKTNVDLNGVYNAIANNLTTDKTVSIKVTGLEKGLFCYGSSGKQFFSGAGPGSVSINVEEYGRHEYDIPGTHDGARIYKNGKPTDQYVQIQNTAWAYHYRATVKINGTQVYQIYCSSSNNSVTNESNASEDATRWAASKIYGAVKIPVGYPLVTEYDTGEQVLCIPEIRTSITWSTTGITLGAKNIAQLYLGGNVWESIPDNKTGNEIKANNSMAVAGIEVTLVDVNNGKIVSIMTDDDGDYGFKNLNQMHKYYVKFRYNGMQYIQANGTDTIADPGVGITATEIDRTIINTRFSTISASNGNYENQTKKSFGYYSKLKNNDEYISWSNTVETNKTNAGALRYCDALYILQQSCKSGTNYDRKNRSTINNTYYDINLGGQVKYENYEGALKNGINNISDASDVWKYMIDTLVTANTNKKYPIENQFVIEDIGEKDDTHINATVLGYKDLYRTSSDQARHVDYGIKLREIADLALQKDVYKAIVVVNGKRQEYKYSKKGTDNDWEIEARVDNNLYNGQQSYGREIRKSEYLYDGSISDGTLGNTSNSNDVKNLQVYVTYRIAVKNQGTISTTVNEIVDYYDANYYTYVDSSSAITSNNTFIGDRNGNKDANQILNVSNSSNCISSKAKLGAYTAIYLSGFSTPIAKGTFTFAYVTFKVNVDENTGRIKLNEDLNNGSLKQGNRNIAEINQYSTGTSNGIVDVDSNSGNLTTRDFDKDGNIITSKNAVDNRIEDDVDKAPNIIVYIPKKDVDATNFNGYVFEDKRTEVKDGAVVGNGFYKTEDGDVKINGVTVELVELVQNVDSEGLSLGTYAGEHIWSTTTYKLSDLKADPTIDWTRYYSGEKSGNDVYSKVILTGDSDILKVNPLKLNENGADGNGAYSFTSVPPGDFFIRFIYGDTTQTTLTSNSNNEVNELLYNIDTEKDNKIDSVSGLLKNGFISNSGLNEKSYNGQDYKSTIYQSEVSQNSAYSSYNSYTQISPDGNATVNGYTQYENQNYSILKDSGGITKIVKNNGTDKSSMYYYDISSSESKSGISSAKDVYAYRQDGNDWSTGANGSSLLNNRAEIMQSFEKNGTYTYNSSLPDRATAQRTMIETLMENTKMVAQTGLINSEIEKNTKTTDTQADKLKNPEDINNILSQGDTNDLQYQYNVTNINLGLVERAEAQLKLTKKATSIKIVLANGQTLFDTKQSVNNLYFANHIGHTALYDNEAKDNTQPNTLKETGFRLSKVAVSANSKQTPELIQGYMDDELMQGSTIDIRYEIIVENVGEIDYLDKQFYYTGKTNNATESNMSRTDATRVIDYVSNMLKYEKNKQDSDTNWKVILPSELYNGAQEEGQITNETIEKELVNREYFDRINTYNTIITTNNLSIKDAEDYHSQQTIWENNTKKTYGLLPKAIKSFDANKNADISNKFSTKTTLELNTAITAEDTSNYMAYNNLTEIIETKNSQGRRMQYSISGNQKMADQDLGNDASNSEITAIDMVTPSEIDADSAQKVLLLPPTGNNKNYSEIIAIIICSLIIIIGGIIMIKQRKQ